MSPGAKTFEHHCLRQALEAIPFNQQKAGAESLGVEEGAFWALHPPSLSDNTPKTPFLPKAKQTVNSHSEPQVQGRLGSQSLGLNYNPLSPEMHLNGIVSSIPPFIAQTLLLLQDGQVPFLQQRPVAGCVGTCQASGCEGIRNAF